jgi:hypothetical protein
MAYIVVYGKEFQSYLQENTSASNHPKLVQMKHVLTGTIIQETISAWCIYTVLGTIVSGNSMDEDLIYF